jgi:hypothetical protein
MRNGNHYESRLWKLLEQENLADLSQFHQRGFFDEVPLYSRSSDIDFLAGKSEILLTFALKFLQSVIAYERHEKGYFAAITIWDFPAHPVVPNLFVWCDKPRALKAKLVLGSVRTPFAKRMRKLLGRSGFAEFFRILEDTSTTPEATRVFIAPARPPYTGFARLSAFRKPAVAAK